LNHLLKFSANPEQCGSPQPAVDHPHRVSEQSEAPDSFVFTRATAFGPNPVQKFAISAEHTDFYIADIGYNDRTVSCDEDGVHAIERIAASGFYTLDARERP